MEDPGRISPYRRRQEIGENQLKLKSVHPLSDEYSDHGEEYKKVKDDHSEGESSESEGFELNFD